MDPIKVQANCNIILPKPEISRDPSQSEVFDLIRNSILCVKESNNDVKDRSSGPLLVVRMKTSKETRGENEKN